jgi:hypothetical protein
MYTVFAKFFHHLVPKEISSQKNNSSRNEIHEKNSKTRLDRLKTNKQIAKELKITPILDKLLE